MVRTPEESPGFPMSNHHPKCEEYELAIFWKVSDGDGGSFIDTEENASELINEEDDYSYAGVVLLTQDQFDSLPEYQP
jgi:hypothetical protein